MAWNGSNRKQCATAAVPRKTGKPRPLSMRGIILGGVCSVIAFCVVYFTMFRQGKNGDPLLTGTKKSAAIKDVVPTATKAHTNERQTRTRKDVAEVARTFNDQVKEFIKKSPGTNKITWIVAPLDPSDPDNALRQGITQELGSLLSVEPGEEMPPFPYSFLIEDDMKEAAAKGDDVGEIDNGNKSFLESLKKWKIAAKETDDDHRLEHKQKLIEAQTELLAGIDEGISVNDAIRAAYEFRKRAYEMRSTIVSTLTELYAEDGDAEHTIRQIKDLNNRLAEEGIKKIAVGEVIEDYENPDEKP